MAYSGSFSKPRHSRFIKQQLGLYKVVAKWHSQNGYSLGGLLTVCAGLTTSS